MTKSDKARQIVKDGLVKIGNSAIETQARTSDRKRDKDFQTIEVIRRKEAENLYKQQQVDSRLAKAALIPRTGEQASTINFMFNPTDLSLSRSVSITPMNGARTQRGLPKVNFGFVEPYKLSLAGILFDTYETGGSVLNEIQPLLDAVDFSKFQDPFKKEEAGGKKYQERVVQATMGNQAAQELFTSVGKNFAGVNVNALEYKEYGAGKIGEQILDIRRPPVFYFIWGDKNYMCCMVKQLDYKLTMFLPNGTPVRAMVNITLEEVDLGVADRGFSARQSIISK
ncbi:CIS tube protein [Microcoleus sp. D3_18a_C4]|uniref:CIS tube protein n=1 Tax=unclassified Microcoleus TaxID=2642155 RepID=UPI002FD0C708